MTGISDVRTEKDVVFQILRFQMKTGGFFLKKL